MSERQKKTETFIIKIMNQQNSTWQGSVTWVDEQREPSTFAVLWSCSS